MPTTGDNLGHYRIGAKLGEGGMGEVWRATDTKLNREVAVKVLPAAVAGDALRLARFTREAQVLASLNHPNIAAIYGVEDRALVMELVEGPTLAEKIATGPLSLDEALPIARQMAEALAYAHEKGIVHRDLKPANVKVTPDGAVKILDFGLAKAMATESSTGAAGSDAATTLSSATTLAGTVLGTAAYMAPEQARGQAVDRRADVWAYGVVLYELLTGERPFGGPTVSDTLAAVLTKEPDLEKVPARLRPLLATCLQKNPRERWGCMSDLRRGLDAAPLSGPATTALSRRFIFALAAAAIVWGAVTAAVAWWFKPPPARPAATVVRFSSPLPAGQTFSRTNRRVIDISPDGSKILYLANRKLYVRALNSLDAQAIPGTPSDLYDAIFSPDGRWIAYFTPTSPDVLQKIPVSGGTPVTLCQLKGAVYGASWSDGRIVFGDDGAGFSGIESVRDSGGIPTVLATIPPSDVAANPLLVDGGRRLLFDDFGSAPEAGQQRMRRIVAQVPGSPASRRTLVADGADARLLPVGQLLFMRGTTLYRAPFDASNLAITGSPVPLIEGLAHSVITLQGQFAIAKQGTMVYWSAPAAALLPNDTLTWVDRHGHATPLPAPLRPYRAPRVSPDGKRIAVGIISDRAQAADVWIWNTVRATLSRLSFGPGFQIIPAWSPDGRTVYYGGGPPFELFEKAADGAGPATLIAAQNGLPRALTPDGKLAITAKSLDSDGLDLVPIEPGSTPRPLLTAPGFVLTFAAPSPDGRWIAYQSNESGQSEIYVRPFPDVNDGKWQVSTTLGVFPLWSRNGRELYFVGGSQDAPTMMAATVRTGPGFSVGTPRSLFSYKPYLGIGNFERDFDVAPDGRFLMVKPVIAPGATESLTVVTGWAQTLPPQASQ